MSPVSDGRLEMLTLKVTRPEASFETTMLVMSGAFAISPVESRNVCELSAVLVGPANAAGTAASASSAAARSTFLIETVSLRQTPLELTVVRSGAAVSARTRMPPPGRRRTLVRAVTALLPELSSVRLRETESELVVEVDVPADVALPQLAARLSDGVLTITVPRTQPEAD